MRIWASTSVSAALACLFPCVAAEPQPEAWPKETNERLPDALRALARRVESEESSRNPAAQGLASRVGELLQRQALPPRKGLLEFVRLPRGSLELMPSVCGGVGLIFNASAEGIDAEILELGRLAEAAIDPLPSRYRIAALAMSRNSTYAPGKRRQFATDALSLARNRLAQQPQSAEAHSWVAACLGVHPDETSESAVASAQRALQLDSQCWRAMLVIGEAELARAKFELQPAGTPPPDVPSQGSDPFLRILYDNPPDDTRVASMEKAIAAADQWFIRASAAAPQEPETYLRRVAATTVGASLYRGLAKLAREQRPSSFAAMQAMAAQMQSFGDTLDAMTFDVLDVAAMRPEDPQLLCGTRLLHFFPVVLQVASSGKTDQLSARDMQLTEVTLAKLRLIEGGPDRTVAAKAAEAQAVLISVTNLLSGSKFDAVLEPCLRALVLDPGRHSAWEILCAHAAQNGRFAALNAATEIRLARWPSAHSHSECAGAAAKLKDWDRSRRHLDEVIKAEPENIGARIELAGVRLCEAAEKGTLSALQADFDDLRDKCASGSTPMSSTDSENLIVNLIVFLCLQKQWQAADQIMTACVADGRIPAAVANDIRALAPK